MADNTTTAIKYTILARALESLRSATVMPRLVYRDYENRTAEKNDTITIQLPGSSSVTDVVPSNTSPNPAGITPTTTTLVMDQWKKCTPFKLSDRDLLEIDANKDFIPVNLSAGVKSLTEYVNAAILGLYKGVYGSYGTPGTTPFADKLVTGASQVKKVLNDQLCPLNPRRLVLDTAADAAADLIGDFTMDKSGSNLVAMEGLKGHKAGFDWYMDQQVPNHTAGTLTGTIVVSAHAIGVTTITLTTGSGEAVALLDGDIITIAGQTQTYAIIGDVTIGASTTGTAVISPGLVVATAGTEEISVKADHAVNLAFHPNAFAFASRPQTARPGTAQLFDPLSGLTLRLEEVVQYKQTMYEIDILYGVKLIRPELAVRLFG